MLFYPRLLLWTYVLMPAICLLLVPTFVMALARAQQQRAKVMANALTARGRAAAAIARNHQRRFVPTNKYHPNNFAPRRSFKVRSKRDSEDHVPQTFLPQDNHMQETLQFRPPFAQTFPDQTDPQNVMLEENKFSESKIIPIKDASDIVPIDENTNGFKRTHGDQQDESLGQLQNMWNMNDFGQHEMVMRAMPETTDTASFGDHVGNPRILSSRSKDYKPDYDSGAFSGRNVYDDVVGDSPDMNFRKMSASAIEENVGNPQPTLKKKDKILFAETHAPLPYPPNYHSSYSQRPVYQTPYEPYRRDEESEESPPTDQIVIFQVDPDELISDQPMEGIEPKSADPTIKKIKKLKSLKIGPTTYHSSYSSHMYHPHSHFRKAEEEMGSTTSGEQMHELIMEPIDERVGSPEPTLLLLKKKKKILMKKDPSFYYPPSGYNSYYGSSYAYSQYSPYRRDNEMQDIGMNSQTVGLKAPPTIADISPEPEAHTSPLDNQKPRNSLDNFDENVGCELDDNILADLYEALPHPTIPLIPQSYRSELEQLNQYRAASEEVNHEIEKTQKENSMDGMDIQENQEDTPNLTSSQQEKSADPTYHGFSHSHYHSFHKGLGKLHDVHGGFGISKSKTFAHGSSNGFNNGFGVSGGQSFNAGGFGHGGIQTNAQATGIAEAGNGFAHGGSSNAAGSNGFNSGSFGQLNTQSSSISRGQVFGNGHGLNTAGGQVNNFNNGAISHLDTHNLAQGGLNSGGLGHLNTQGYGGQIFGNGLGTNSAAIAQSGTNSFNNGAFGKGTAQATATATASVGHNTGPFFGNSNTAIAQAEANSFHNAGFPRTSDQIVGEKHEESERTDLSPNDELHRLARSADITKSAVEGLNLASKIVQSSLNQALGEVSSDIPTESSQDVKNAMNFVPNIVGSSIKAGEKLIQNDSTPETLPNPLSQIIKKVIDEGLRVRRQIKNINTVPNGVTNNLLASVESNVQKSPQFEEVTPNSPTEINNPLPIVIKPGEKEEVSESGFGLPKLSQSVSGLSNQGTSNPEESNLQMIDPDLLFTTELITIEPWASNWDYKNNVAIPEVKKEPARNESKNLLNISDKDLTVDNKKLLNFDNPKETDKQDSTTDELEGSGSDSISESDIGLINGNTNNDKQSVIIGSSNEAETELEDKEEILGFSPYGGPQIVSSTNKDSLKGVQASDNATVKEEERIEEDTNLMALEKELPFLYNENGSKKNMSELTSEEIQELQFDIATSTPRIEEMKPRFQTPIENEAVENKVDVTEKSSNVSDGFEGLPQSELDKKVVNASSIFHNLPGRPFASIESEMALLTEEEKEAFMRQEVDLIADVIEESLKKTHFGKAYLKHRQPSQETQNGDGKMDRKELVVAAPHLLQTYDRNDARTDYREARSSVQSGNDFDAILGQHKQKIEDIKKDATAGDEDLLMISFIGDSVIKDLETRKNKTDPSPSVSENHTNSSSIVSMVDSSGLQKLGDGSVNRTKRAATARISRAPLTQLISDPTTKLDIDKTFQNLGSIARHTFENPSLPMYHVRNMLGNTKNTVMSAAKAAPNNFLVPSKYEIAKISGNDNDEVVGDINEKMLIARGKDAKLGALTGEKITETPSSIGKSLGIDDTFQKIGAIVKESVKSGKDVVAHANDAAMDAKNFWHSTRKATPRLEFPQQTPLFDTRSLFPTLGSQVSSTPAFITPKLFDIQSNNLVGATNPAKHPENFLGMGNLLDATGLSYPTQPKYELKKYLFEPLPLGHMNPFYKLQEPLKLPNALNVETFKKPVVAPSILGSQMPETSNDSEPASTTETMKDFMLRMHNEMLDLVKNQYEERKKNRQLKIESYQKPMENIELPSLPSSSDILGAASQYYNSLKNSNQMLQKSLAPKFMNSLTERDQKAVDLNVVEDTKNVPQPSINLEPASDEEQQQPLSNTPNLPDNALDSENDFVNARVSSMQSPQLMGRLSENIPEGMDESPIDIPYLPSTMTDDIESTRIPLKKSPSTQDYRRLLKKSAEAYETLINSRLTSTHDPKSMESDFMVKQPHLTFSKPITVDEEVAKTYQTIRNGKPNVKDSQQQYESLTQPKKAPNTLENTVNSGFEADNEKVSLYLPPELMKPFMGQPSETLMHEYLRENGDEDDTEIRAAEVPKTVTTNQKPIATTDNPIIVPVALTTPKVKVDTTSLLNNLGLLASTQHFSDEKLNGIVGLKEPSEFRHEEASKSAVDKEKDEFVRLLSDSTSDYTNENKSGISSFTEHEEANTERKVELTGALEDQKSPSLSTKTMPKVSGHLLGHEDLGYVLGAINPMMFERHFNERLKIKDIETKNSPNKIDDHSNKDSSREVGKTVNESHPGSHSRNDTDEQFVGQSLQGQTSAQNETNLQSTQIYSHVSQDDQDQHKSSNTNSTTRTSMKILDAYQKPFLGYLTKDKIHKFLQKYNNDMPQNIENTLPKTEDYLPIKQVIFEDLDNEDYNYGY